MLKLENIEGVYNAHLYNASSYILCHNAFVALTASKITENGVFPDRRVLPVNIGRVLKIKKYVRTVIRVWGKIVFFRSAAHGVL